MFQFNLRSLFVLTTAVAVLVWILFTPPEWVGVLALIVIFSLIPAANLAGLIYHRGPWRAFFIGMTPTVLICAWYMFWMPMSGPRYGFGFNSPIETKLALLFVLAIILGSGLVAMGVRWWDSQIPEPPSSP